MFGFKNWFPKLPPSAKWRRTICNLHHQLPGFRCSKMSANFYLTTTFQIPKRQKSFYIHQIIVRYDSAYHNLFVPQTRDLIMLTFWNRFFYYYYYYYYYYYVSVIMKNFALTFWKLSVFVYRIEISEILPSFVLTLNVVNLLAPDALKRLTASGGMAIYSMESLFLSMNVRRFC